MPELHPIVHLVTLLQDTKIVILAGVTTEHHLNWDVQSII
jgi:hypothetical protein